MTDVYVGNDGTAPSDGELILEVRSGSLDAYGALYSRHAAAAKVLARQYVRSESDADDVVAEAFHRVLGVLQQGNGPDTHFRAYLFTVVRRLAADLAKGARRLRPTDDDGTFELALGPSSSPEDPALAGFESTVVARAYEGLPERWQAVLWYTEVECMSPAEVAPILGLTPNGVSALAYRAREGLRVGYLQEHLTAEPADSCRAINPMLGGYVRGSLARREAAKVDKHLEDCGGCRTLVLELGDVAHGMRTVIGPLVVGVAGMALLGALPLGVAALGAGTAGAGAGLGATGAASGGVGAGTLGAGTLGAGTGGAGVGTAGAGVGAGAGTAGAGVGAATGATTTAAATAASTTATTAATAATATTATAATASTATSVATTAVLATSTAGVSGVTVAASAGAVAAATVGVVSVLGAMGGGEPADITTAPPAYEAAPWPSEEAVLPEPATEPEEPSVDPTNPANVPEFVDPDVVESAVLPAPAAVSVKVGDADVLQPRVVQGIDLEVTNSGGTAAANTQVQVDLPTGMALAATSSPMGASVAAPVDASALPCTPTEQPSQALCRVGTLEPGQTRSVTVPVRVDAGGSYPLSVNFWADGVESASRSLAAAQVAYFGPELSATTGGVVAAANPGRADVTFRIENTGDRPASAGWVTRVRVPKGLVPQAIIGNMTCEPAAAAKDSENSVWRCAGDELAPGASAAGTATVVADGTTSEGDYQVQVVPVLPDDRSTRPTTATVPVGRAWAGAASGAGAVAASCQARGGVGVADAVVTGTYNNLTAQTVRVRFSAAGSSISSSGELAPGNKTSLTLPDGLRVPAGSATWTLSTTVAGTTYRHEVSGENHGSAECYSPSWKVDSSATVVNDGGRVRVEGTITNQTDEPMQATMSAAGDRSDGVRLGAGDTVTLGITTGQTSLDAGTVTFDLNRWVTDVDGDLPPYGVVPTDPPTASYRSAKIDPAAGQAMTAGECTYDASSESSTRMFSVPLDNSGSTEPVSFVVRAGSGAERVTLAAGEKTTVEVRVPWGTGTGTVTADGRDLRALDVGFASCATAPAEWPGSVTATAAPQCSDGVASLDVDVANDGGRTWRAAVLRGGEVIGSKTLIPGSSVTFTGGDGTAWLRSGKVTVTLTRTIEDTEFTVEQTVEHTGTRCVVIDPKARLDNGPMQMDRHNDWAASWRKIGVELDNRGSTVPVRFHVVGPNGLAETIKVPAGETRDVEGRRVEGKQGATYTVSTSDWSTTLESGTFTAADAGWCEERIQWGTQYAKGAVQSWNSFNYSYTGWDGTAPDGAATQGPGAKWWDNGHWNGQWKQWEKIGLCEYR